MKTKKGWYGNSQKHSMASRGISSKIPKNKLTMPNKIYHGTDMLSWKEIQKIGIINRPDKKAKNTELGYLYGTTEEGWAKVYAKTRAENIMDFWDLESYEGVILEIDLKGLNVEYDPTVALDVLTAYRVPLPISPDRIKLHKIIKVEK